MSSLFFRSDKQKYALSLDYPVKRVVMHLRLVVASNGMIKVMMLNATNLTAVCEITVVFMVGG